MRDLVFADLLTFICADCGEPHDAATEEDAAEQHDLGQPGHDFIAAPADHIDTPSDGEELALLASSVL